jgi:hypothetical protein
MIHNHSKKKKGLGFLEPFATRKKERKRTRYVPLRWKKRGKDDCICLAVLYVNMSCDRCVNV